MIIVSETTKSLHGY